MKLKSILLLSALTISGVVSAQELTPAQEFKQEYSTEISDIKESVKNVCAKRACADVKGLTRLVCVARCKLIIRNSVFPTNK